MRIYWIKLISWKYFGADFDLAWEWNLSSLMNLPRFILKTFHNKDYLTINYYTNSDLCRIPRHATQAMAGLSGTWAEADRPIGRSPGVPEKSSHFLFLCGFGWKLLQDCHYAQCPLPLSIVIRMRLVIGQSKLPACLVEVQLAHVNSLWHLCHRIGEMDR